MNKTKSEILSEMSELLRYFADLVKNLANLENPVSGIEVQAEVQEEPKPQEEQKTLVVAQTQEEQKTQEEPQVKEEPEITREQVRETLQRIADAGLTRKVIELLNSYGTNKLSGVDPKDYASLKAKAEAVSNG